MRFIKFFTYTFFIVDSGERGQCVLDTPPKILFCDLRLDPGESKTCKRLNITTHFETNSITSGIDLFCVVYNFVSPLIGS